MEIKDGKEVCIKCGEHIHADYSVSIKTVMKLSDLNSSEYVNRICELEGISKERAQEYVDHKMGHNCNSSEPPCPKCAAPLKTWHAKMCLKCGWQRDLSKNLTEYYR